MNSKHLTRTLAGLILTASGLAFPALATASANAAPVAHPARHCVTAVDGARQTTCYATFTEAIRQATGGRVTDAPASGAAAARDASFAAKVNAAGAGASQANALRAAVGAPAASDTIISIEYLDRDKDEKGGQQIWTADKGCPDSNSNDVDHKAPDVGWTDNQISSFQGYTNCMVTHFDGKSYGGASIGPSWGKDYIGDAMNDRTSSLQWT
jgi:hypothetical protein